MAILELQELGHGRRRASFSSTFRKSTDTGDFQRDQRLVRPYRAVMDDPEEDEVSVLALALTQGLPFQWQEHPSDAAMVVTSYDVEEEETPERWIISVVYETAQDPTDEPALISRSTGSLDWVVEQDIISPPNAITASNHRPFEPPPTIPNGHLIVTVTKNLPSFSDQDITDNYLFHVNASTFLGFDAGQVWLAEASAGALEFRNGIEFYPTRWVFHARKRGWKLKLLDCGFEEYDPVTQTWLTIRDRAGQPVATPALLDGTGARLDPGDPPVFLEYEVYESAEFDALGLGV